MVTKAAGGHTGAPGLPSFLTHWPLLIKCHSESGMAFPNCWPKSRALSSVLQPERADCVPLPWSSFSPLVHP